MTNATTLTEIRVLLGMSQGELAEAVGTSLRSIAFYESGKREVPDDIAEQLRHMLQTYIDTRTRSSVRRAIEDGVAMTMPTLSVGAVPDGWLATVERALFEIATAVPPQVFGRPLAVRLSAPVGRLVLDVGLDPSTAAQPDADGFRAWLKERADKLTADSRCTCARCGSAGASIEISGWAWPLCPPHAIKRKVKETGDEPIAA